MKFVRLLLLTLLPAGYAPFCSQSKAAPAQAAAQASIPDKAPHLAGRVEDERLNELSGLAASRRFAGWVWAHNDSRDQARLFLLDQSGRTRAVVSLPRAKSVDWEDIAVAGDERDSQVIVADCGDNGRSRDSITLYRFSERDLVLSIKLNQEPRGTAPEIEIEPQSLTLHYPTSTPEVEQGAQDAEALAANAYGDLLLITKSTGPTRFYLARWPRDDKGDGTQLLKLVAQRQFGSREPGRRRVHEMLVTAADFSPNRSQMAVITYASLYVWKLPVGPWDKLDWQAVLAHEPQLIALPEMRQWESAAWNGSNEILVSAEGEHPPLWAIPVPTSK